MEECTTVELPEVSNDFCAPEIYYGQIERIWMGNPDQPDFGDWTLIGEWTPRLDDSSVVDHTFIRSWNVVGDKPEPETDERIISRGRTVNSSQKNTINFRTEEISPKNRAFVKYTQENPGLTLPIWYATRDHQYGGNSGILAAVKMAEVIPEGREELIEIKGTLKWEGVIEDRADLIL